MSITVKAYNPEKMTEIMRDAYMIATQVVGKRNSFNEDEWYAIYQKESDRLYKERGLA